MQWFWCGLFVLWEVWKEFLWDGILWFSTAMRTVCERGKSTKSVLNSMVIGGKRSRFKLNFSSLRVIGWISSSRTRLQWPRCPYRVLNGPDCKCTKEVPYVISKTRNTALAREKTFSVFRLNCFRWSEIIREVENDPSDFFLPVPKCSRNDWCMPSSCIRQSNLLEWMEIRQG